MKPGRNTVYTVQVGSTKTSTVTGNGTYLSDAITVNAAGMYHWIANYSGDGNNDPVSVKVRPRVRLGRVAAHRYSLRVFAAQRGSRAASRRSSAMPSRAGAGYS